MQVTIEVTVETTGLSTPNIIYNFELVQNGADVEYIEDTYLHNYSKDRKGWFFKQFMFINVIQIIYDKYSKFNQLIV